MRNVSLRFGASHASALVLTLVFVSVCLIVMAGALSWSTTNTRLTHRFCEYTRAQAAAEAATEKLLTTMVTDFREQGQGHVWRNLQHYETLVPNANEDGLWAGYEFFDRRGTKDRLDVEFVARNNYRVLSSKFQGLRGFPNVLRVRANARLADSVMNVSGAVQQEVEISSIPLFQFALFYNLDLECNALPLMQVNGPVHCNKNIYLTPVRGLTFHNDVTAAGRIYHSAKPGNLFGVPGPVTYGGLHEGGVSTLNLPIGTNNSPDAVRQVIEIPPPGESFTSSIGLQRYFNKADMIILVSNDAIRVSSGRSDLFRTLIPESTATNFVRTNASFYNGRERKTVRVIDIDVGQVADLNRGGLNPLRGAIPGGDIRTIYVADQRVHAAGNQPGIRLVNGQQLPREGLTVASPQPVYILGNYNVHPADVGTTNTTRSLPASVVADAITILSAAWDDTKGGSALSSRVAQPTTVNAAFLAGIVETAPGKGYSGGVENFPRFLEEWTGVTFTYNGSMVVMFTSKVATNIWDDIGIYYNPPVRNWAFDQNFTEPMKLPPSTPFAAALVRGAWKAPALAKNHW